MTTLTFEGSNVENGLVIIDFIVDDFLEKAKGSWVNVGK